MALRKEDFTEEQWAEIQAETDRRATEATKTAYKNAAKEAAEAQQAAIQKAIEDERARLEMNEQQKLEAERKKIEDAQKALAADRKSLAATKKLLAAGLPEESVDAVLPLFVNLADAQFDSAVDSFISLNENLVKARVDAAKQELLHNAQPPAGSPNAPTDKQTAAAAALKSGNEAMAIDLMLEMAEGS